MSKYTENAHEHERINKNCRIYRERHRAEYNRKIRAYRVKKLNNMSSDELQQYRAKRATQQRIYRAKLKKIADSNN